MAHEHNPDLKLQPKGKFPGPLVAIVVAAAILAVIIYYLPRTHANPAPPAGAQVPAQQTGQQVQVSHLEIVPDPTGNAVRLRGMMFNGGQTTIDSLELAVSYQDKNGKDVRTDHAPVAAVDKDGEAKPLSQDPVKPGETRPFQVTLDHVPPQWNHEMPAVQVADVLANKP